MLALLAVLALANGDIQSDTWVATDGLGRKLPIGTGVRKDRFVGVFYFVWHGFHGTPGPYDISKITAAHPPNQGFGPVGAFHWWGEPEIGYFRDTDPWVARRNLQLLGEAGVDCLFLDATNAFTYHDEVELLFQTAAQMRKEGNPTPQVAFILNASVVPTLNRLWDDWYAPGRYRDLWFRWKGKPLLLADPNEPISTEQKSFFTWRRSWFETDPHGWFGDGKDRWPWRDRTPQNYGWHDDPKKPEEVAVGVASHPIGMNIGRSYRNGKEPALSDFKEGLQFQEQWDRALALDPEMVFVTGWNEWVAQRFLVAKGQSMNLAGRDLKEGETFFVDQYNAEFSRDIDPMKGGYEDNYYYQLVANIRRFKGARPIPKASPPKTIDPRGSFAQWQSVRPEYRDVVGDTMHRNFAGWGDLQYRDDSGNNDIVAAKVARDGKSLAFYVRTAAPLQKGENGMILYLDMDQNAATGWHSYDFRVVAGRLEHWAQGWRPVAAVQSRSAGNELQLTFPRVLVNYRRGLDFKWADHSDDSGMFLTGDAAPDRRFNFRYQE